MFFYLSAANRVLVTSDNIFNLDTIDTLSTHTILKYRLAPLYHPKITEAKD